MSITTFREILHRLAHPRRRPIRNRYPQPAHKPRLEALEDRTVPSTVMWNKTAAPTGGNWSVPGNWNTGSLPGPNDDVVIPQLSSGAVIFFDAGTQTVQSFTDEGANLTIHGGNNLTVTGLVTIPSGQTLTVNGTLNLGGTGGDTVELGTSFSGTAEILVSNSGALLKATNTTFTAVGGHTNQIVVTNSGALQASGCTFGPTSGVSGSAALTQVELDATSTPLGAGDLAGNAFDSPLFVPAADVPLLANNLRFQDIDIQQGTWSGTTPLALNAIGTSGSPNLRYVFPAGFTVQQGAAVNVGPNVHIAVPEAGETITVNGTLTFNGGTGSDRVDLDSGGAAPAEILVSGGGALLNATGTAFTSLGGAGPTEILVNNGGQFNAFGCTFGPIAGVSGTNALTQVNLGTGSIDSLQFNTFASPFIVNSGASIAISSNDFSNVGAHGVQAVGNSSDTITLDNNYWGTTDPTAIQALILDHSSDTTRPTVSFANPLGTRPVAPHFSIRAPAGVTVGSPFSITVTVVDQFNNTITGYTGTVHFTTTDGGTGAAVPANYTFVSGDNGVHTFPSGVTFVTVGSQTVTATDTANSNATGSATVAVGAAAATHFTVSGPAGAAAGTPFIVTVTALDPFNNTATGYTGTVHFTSSDAQAALPANGTLSSGTESFIATLKTAGSQTITATDTASSSITGTSGAITVSATVAAATHFSVSAPGSATAGSPFSVTVTALDQNNNVVRGYTGTVHFTKSDGGSGSAVPSDYTFVSGDNGAHTFTNGVTFVTAGGQTVTAADTLNGSVAGTSGAVTVGAAAATHFSVSGPGSASAGGPFLVTVTALDAFNNTATGYAGTVHFTSTDAQAALPQDGKLTNGAGTFIAVLKTAGSQTVTATDTATSSVTGTSGAITVAVVAATHFAVSAPASATTGSAFSVTVTALDTFNNVVKGYTGTVHFSKTDGGAGSAVPSDYTFVSGDNGVHTFSNGVTLVTGGSQTVTATDTASGSITGTSNAIAVNAVKHFAALSSATGVVRDSDAGNQQLTVASGATRLAVDPAGDTVAEFAGYGVWLYTNAVGWQQLTPANASLLAIDNAGEVFGEFPGSGVWEKTPGVAWKQLTTVDATQLTADAIGDVFGTFAGSGVWKNTPGAGWKQLTTVDAAVLAAGAAGEVVGTFKGSGVWQYTPGTGWKQLTTVDAAILAEDAAGDVVGEFLGSGVWKYDPVKGWAQLTATDASALAAS